MKKNHQFLFLTFFIGSVLSAQIVDNTIDDPGDIVITAYHNNPDGFSFVFLDNCPDGTTIRFIDEEWGGSSFVSTSTEGEVLWENNTGGTIAQGTVVHVENANDNLPGIMASVGVATEDDGGFSLDSSDDGIIAVTGTRASPGVFLAFFGDTTDSTLSGTSLVNGATANQQASYGTGYYSGVANCDGLTITQCSARLNNFSNWTVAETFTYTGDTMSSLIVGGVLSDKGIDSDLEVLCYPNPVNGILNIHSKQKIEKLILKDSTGKIKSLVENTISQNKINMSGFSPGIYFVELELNNRKITQKVVKF